MNINPTTNLYSSPEYLYKYIMDFSLPNKTLIANVNNTLPIYIKDSKTRRNERFRLNSPEMLAHEFITSPRTLNRLFYIYVNNRQFLLARHFLAEVTETGKLKVLYAAYVDEGVENPDNIYIYRDINEIPNYQVLGNLKDVIRNIEGRLVLEGYKPEIYNNVYEYEKYLEEINSLNLRDLPYDEVVDIIRNVKTREVLC